MTTAIPTQPLTAAAFLFGDTKEDSVDALVATVHFELSVKFVVKGLVATVQHGRLVALSGGCDVAATLTAEGRQLAKREAQLQLPLLVRLGGGIPLLHDIEAPPTSVSVKLEE